VWAQTILRASGLFGAMSARMSALVDGLFNTIPTILSYVQTAYFLRQVIGSITPIETEQRWIQKLIDLNKAYFRQLAGELLILSLCRRESDWARSMVDAGLSETYGMAFRRGMTYGAAALIGNERHGEIVEQILIRAMESGKPELSGAAKTFVNNIGEHNWNTSVKHLIQRLFEHDALIQAVEEPLAWRMESVALIDAESALGIAEDLMRKRAARGQQSGWFGAASHMTSIAVEAQRDTSLRDRALSFFEMLLTLDFPEAREAADNMNHR
jgi:hypothetical protein